MTFDDVIPTLLGICELTPGFSTLEAACVVRDLRGRVRLVVAPRDTSSPIDLHALSERLSAALGGYFQGPILSTRGPQEQARLARNLVQMAEAWPASWSDTYRHSITGAETRKDDRLWRSFQRLLSKEAWLSGARVKAPWELTGENPPIIAFYSFKGGVGRTTLLAAMAWHMARSGRRAVVVDLDLEAPGAATLLDARSDRGVIDYIVDHVASGSASLTGCHGQARALGREDSARVDVFPAGATGWSYIEKLARLDYSATGPGAADESPVASALKALLTAIKDEVKPDFILVDSRAGLHDLGGLSLHALSHVDVLLTRAGQQSLQGLELTVQALARRKDLGDDSRCIVVHSFAPPRQDGEERTDEERSLSRATYRIFTDHVYGQQDREAPSEDNADALHFPSVIFQHRDVERVDTMAAAPQSIIFGSDYQGLYQRILEQCGVADTGPKGQETAG